MIFGFADVHFSDGEQEETQQEEIQRDPLDVQIEALQLEIKTLEKEIQIKEAEQKLDDDSTNERRQKQIADMERQISSFSHSIEFEQKRLAHYQTEITKLEGKPLPEPEPDTSDEQIAAVTASNEQLSLELKSLYRDIANECGPDFNIDELLKSNGSTAAQRVHELQSLQAEISKYREQDYRQIKGVDEALDKVSKIVDPLLAQKGDLEVEIASLKGKISRSREKVDKLEDESRALRMMDVLLQEKLEHDADLIPHLRELNEQKSKPIMEEEVPKVTSEFVEQLRAQERIVQGLCWKLAQAQKELENQTVPESFTFLTQQLQQLNGRCIQLQNEFLKREIRVTNAVAEHIEE